MQNTFAASGKNSFYDALALLKFIIFSSYYKKRNANLTCETCLHSIMNQKKKKIDNA